MLSCKELSIYHHLMKMCVYVCCIYIHSKVGKDQALKTSPRKQIYPCQFVYVSVYILNTIRLIMNRRFILFTFFQRGFLTFIERTGEGEGGKIWENGIETCIISCMKLVASPVRCTILDAWGQCTGTTQRDGMGREEGGGFRMGNTCIPVADSF